MSIDIHHFHHITFCPTPGENDAPVLAQILSKLTTIMALLDPLTAAVAANTTVVQSAITLIQGLKAQLDAAGTDPAKLQALSDQLGSSDAALAAAVAANTPAAPAA